ncbi:hypothetical protein BCV73_24135 [Paenibacillus sp. SSG-1]|nr:hypothetical protein BCV73_24135 [Paenibacillus sp. SSG-1]
MNMIRSQRFYNFLFSYIVLVVVLLVAVSSVVYQNFFDTLRKEVEHTTVGALGQFRDAVDLRMNEMNRLASQLSYNPVLTPYMASDGGYGSLQAVAELKQYLSTNLFIEDVVLSFNGSGTKQLYAASGTYKLDLFFNSIYHYRNWSQSEFMQTAVTLSAPLMRGVEPVLFNRLEERRYATYMVPIPLNAEVPYGVALFLIREQALTDLAQGVLTESNGFLFILNERNEIVFSQSQGESPESGKRLLERINDIPNRSPFSELSVDGRKYSVLIHSSSNRQWSYVAVLPTDQWMRKVNEKRGIFSITIAAVFLIGIAIAFGFSVQHYRPLKRLAGIVSSEARSEPLVRSSDEIDYISRAVGLMASEKQSLQHQLRNQGRTLREQVLLTLLKGKLSTKAEMSDILQFSNIQLDKPHYAVMIVLIDDYNRFRQDNSEKMQEVLTFSLMKVVEELALESGAGYGAELMDGRTIAFLVNLNEGFDDTDVLRELAVKAKAFFRQYFRLTVTVGIGGIYDDLSSVPQSFVEASHAARYRFVKGGDQVFLFAEIVPRSSGEYVYPVERIDRLVKAIKQGNMSQVEPAVREAFGHIVEMDVSLEAAECICFDIVNNMMKTLIELEIEIDDDLGETMQQLFVPRFETIEELERLVVSICRNVCRYVEAKKESKNIELLENIKAYVAQQYSDQTIDLESIANRFGVSPSYATRFFKDHTGCPLMKYIDSIRMDQAKKLLKTTDLPLKDIMNEVGYVDSTNFIRKFKKAEGITPIRYRNIAKN